MSGVIHRLPIVRTKLHLPAVPNDIVCRERLHDLLDRAREGSLTLVSAPAGYGKSVAVSHWAQGVDVPCGWLSLDESDSDLSTFVSYLIAAIRVPLPGAAVRVESYITSPNPPATSLISRHLVNEIEDIDSDLILVLDDYHRIAPGSEVHDLMCFLVAHLPPRLKLVISTRTDPPLPMASLRAGRQTVEVRLRDLEFTATEVSRWFSQVLDLPLQEAGLANLLKQTEGWAVGLQFVLIYLPQIGDPNAFLQSLRGGVQLTQEYLLQEVLAKQTAVVRDCMLKASVLDRFNAGLLEAVCFSRDDSDQERTSGRDLIETLCRKNLFTISLDATGDWYRYHHLFKALLNLELIRNTTAEEIANLNLRASEWCEAEGLIGDSIGYALQAEMPVRAAEIIDRHRAAEFLADGWHIVEKWLAMLPDDLRQTSPGLLMAEAWILYYRFRLERVAMLVDQIDSLLAGQSPSDDLCAEMGYFKGWLEYWSGNSAESIVTLEGALSLLKGQESFCAAEIQVYLGLARCMNGQGEEAIGELNRLTETAISLEGLYFSHLFIGTGLVQLIRGELRSVCSAARRLIAVTEHTDMANTKGWGHYMLGSGLLSSGELTGALEQLLLASRQRYTLDPTGVADALVGLALAQQMLKLENEADQTLRSLRDFAKEANLENCLAMAESGQARISVLRGDHVAHQSWALSSDRLPEPAELVLWIEVPVMTRARVLIASKTSEGLEKATDLLQNLRELCEGWCFMGQRIEVMVLQSLTLDLQGRSEEAMTSLRDAVAVAKPGRWVRPFLEAGPVMARMMQRLNEKEQPDHFIRHVQASLEAPADTKSWGSLLAAGGDTRLEHLHSPLSQLTNRELDVLGLLARRLHNKEIADQLCVSSHTVNFHLKQIYSKLEVHNRREAVDRGLEMGIIKLRSSN